MNPNNKLYTLITGASSGLGKEMAIECARQGMNLILVALPGRNLHLLCKELQTKCNISAQYYETDLTVKQSIYKLIKWLEQYKINFLINNAGMGGTMNFEDSEPEYLDNIIQLNIRAITLITRLLVPELKHHHPSYILNVSSIAAFSPLPYKTVYPASKAFVTSFSRGLHQELKNTSIKISVVHPGPILTNPDTILRIIKQGFIAKLGLLSANKITRIALQAIKKEKKMIIPGRLNRFHYFIFNLIPPNIRLRILTQMIRRELVSANHM